MSSFKTVDWWLVIFSGKNPFAWGSHKLEHIRDASRVGMGCWVQDEPSDSDGASARWELLCLYTAPTLLLLNHFKEQRMQIRLLSNSRSTVAVVIPCAIVLGPQLPRAWKSTAYQGGAAGMQGCPTVYRQGFLSSPQSATEPTSLQLT